MEKENEKREQQAAIVRQQFPTCAAFATAIRDVFGDGVRMTYAEENGRAIGRKMDMQRGKWIAVADMTTAPLIDTSKPRWWIFQGN